jgi:hypothetical protein
MDEPAPFTLYPRPCRWLGGEPRTFAVDKENAFPHGLPSICEARVIDVRYEGGGLTTLLENVTEACGVMNGSFQAVLENLEDLTHDRPLIIIVRDADRLLADVGPAVLHLMAGWEGFTHHANAVSAMYLVLETGPRAVTNAAFYPGGVVDWR